MTLEQAIHTTAADLDTIRPGWHNEIDPQRLTFIGASNTKDCVLGQLWGSLDVAWEALRAGGYLNALLTWRYAFRCSWHTLQMENVRDPHTPIWLDEIRARQTVEDASLRAIVAAVEAQEDEEVFA